VLLLLLVLLLLSLGGCCASADLMVCYSTMRPSTMAAVAAATAQDQWLVLTPLLSLASPPGGVYKSSAEQVLPNTSGFIFIWDCKIKCEVVLTKLAQHYC
jgi:hypothetical protein